MSGSLSGKIAVVTGAARGLGRAVARAYAAEGATVHALDVLEDEVMSLADENSAIRPGKMDLRDAGEVARVLGGIEAEGGRVDVLVNNAGIIFYKPVEAVSVEDWDRLLDINLRGAFLCCRALAAGMKARRSGAILNLSSNAGIKGGVDESVYCASKFGIEGLSRAWAVEFQPYGVSVNSITPGHPMHTPMSETTYGPETRKIWIDPMELTPAFVHLAADEGAAITDQRIRAWDLVQELRARRQA